MPYALCSMLITCLPPSPAFLPSFIALRSNIIRPKTPGRLFSLFPGLFAYCLLASIRKLLISGPKLCFVELLLPIAYCPLLYALCPMLFAYYLFAPTPCVSPIIHCASL